MAVGPTEYDVRVIDYYPVTSDRNLRCPEAAARQREVERGESILRAPDVSYSDSFPEQKQVYLNAFADRLRNTIIIDRSDLSPSPPPSKFK